MFRFIGPIVTFFFLWILLASQVTSTEISPLRNSDSLVADIIIRILDIEKDRDLFTEIADNLIYLKKSAPFSPKLLEDSIQALRLSKKFSHIDIDSTDSPEGIILIFSLTPFRYIKDIRFSGAHPVFEQTILRAITIHTGDAFVSGDLDKQKKLIENLFIEEGFFKPEINVDIQEDPEDGNVILTFNIFKGDYFRLNQIRFFGNHSISSKRLNLKMKTRQHSFFPGIRGRFIERVLSADIDRLIELYRKNRFAEVKITQEINKDFENRLVDVLITIDEGPFYEMNIEGNKTFWNRTLKQDVVIFEEGNLHDSGIRKSIRNMKTRYQEAGFLEPEIHFEETHEQKKNRQIRKVTFIVNEGPRYVVEHIEISGNTHFDNKEIQKQMLTRLPGIFASGHYLPDTLELDTIAIKTLYAQEGYMEPLVRSETIFSEDRKSAGISIGIEEGPQTMVESTEIKGVTVVSEKEAYDAISLKAGLPFRNYMVRSDENTLSALISPYGYPHVRVTGKVDFNQDRTKAHVVYEVNEGPLVRMGQIYYSGNFRTKEYIVSREIDMMPGEPFSLARMLEGQRTIRDMDIFNSVQFKTIGLMERADDLHLFVEMEEKKPYYIQTGLGYQTDTGSYINLKAGDRNFLGRNKNIWLGGSLSEIGYRTELWFSDPRLFGTNISSNSGTFAEKKEEFNKNFGVKVYGASTGFYKKWTPQLNTGLSARYENRKQYDVDRDVADIDFDETDKEKFRSRNLIVLTPVVSYDTRDSIIRPKKGLFTTVSADISQGLDNDLDSFIKYNFDGRYFLTSDLIPWLTFACLGRAGYIDPVGNVEDIPDDQLFFLGGTSDVRGFKENMLLFDDKEDPVGGRTTMSGSLEARIDLGRNFELTTFLDAGRIRNTEIIVDKTNWRTSAGIGLRYITPIGPVGFLYGHKLDRNSGESPGRIHFAIGYTF